MPSEFDPASRTVSAQTTAMSVWFATSSPANQMAEGALRLINNSANMWLYAHVDRVNSLTFPAIPAVTAGAGAAPPGDLGWSNNILWHVSQGSFRVCLRMNTVGTLNNPPGPPVHWFVDPVLVNLPWISPLYQTSRDLAYSAPPPTAVPGFCPGEPTPTPSTGTGQVQVTLTWFSASGTAVDLDLYVTDPSNNTVSWGTTTVPSGGVLDRDNQCGNYENGRPENIFWTTAPAGQYIVRVDWFGDCYGGPTSMPYTVRIVNKGNVTTFSGSITPAQGLVEVTRFTVVP
jgi:hypothetical protein